MMGESSVHLNLLASITTFYQKGTWSVIFVLCSRNPSIPSIFSFLTLQALLLGIPSLPQYDSFSQMAHIFSPVAFTMP